MVRETETFDDCLLASIGQNSNNQEYKSQTSRLPCWRCQLFVSCEVRMTKCNSKTFKLQSEKYLALFELASCSKNCYNENSGNTAAPCFSFLRTRKTPRLEDVAFVGIWGLCLLTIALRLADYLTNIWWFLNPLKAWRCDVKLPNCKHLETLIDVNDNVIWPDEAMDSKRTERNNCKERMVLCRWLSRTG